MKQSYFTDRRLLTIFFMFFTIQNYAYGACEHTTHELACVEFVRNYDGDTITFNIQKVHPLIGDQISVRVLGVDSAEMTSRDRCENQMAHAAQREVERLMKSARRLDLVNVQRGKYFRVVADVQFDGQSLGDYLIKNRLAVAYAGGHKEIVDWCQF